MDSSKHKQLHKQAGFQHVNKRSSLMKTAKAPLNTTTSDQVLMLSKKGMKEIKKSVVQLEHDRAAIIKGLHDLDRTTGHDDRLERIERLARLESVEVELSEKKQTLSSAKLLPTRRARAKVALGSVVDLIDQQGRLFQYTLVDTIEANPSDGRISVLSPLGQNLIGKTAKEVIEWSNGLRSNTFRLISIR
jgi:transcription elongation GreA/GreB family factor